MELSDTIATAAQAFLAGLDAPQAAAATQPFDDHARRGWQYRPTPRAGVPVGSLTRAQSKAAHRLLATLLALPAFARAVTIMGLDEVLDCLEVYRSDRRHRGDYWVTVFGAPGDAPWATRVEGHHVSVNATVCDGAVRLTPLFLGANPAVVLDGGHPAIAPLALEEQLGFQLLHSLTSEQRSAAVVADQAPPDILSGNEPRLERPRPAPGGVPLAALTGAGSSAARELLALYLGRFPDGAEPPDASDATFSWAGSHQPGAGHYYRVEGPRLLIELDNTQNGANHVHTVVRDPWADFGDDLLAAHYQHSHGPNSGLPPQQQHDDDDDQDKKEGSTTDIHTGGVPRWAPAQSFLTH